MKETRTTQENNASPVVNTAKTTVKIEATGFQSIEYMIYFLFGALEILLTFRLVLKFIGAGISSGFVNLIYDLSGVFILPFEGIFRRMYSQGAETISVLEPSTIVAIIIYAVLAWGIVKLIRIFSGEQQGTD